MSLIKKYFIFFIFVFASSELAANELPFSQNNIAIIVHPENLNSLTARQISNIFLGKTNAFPNKKSATPLDQHDSSLMREVFYREIVGKKLKWVKKYWSKRIFTGEGEPPKMYDADEIKQIVTQDKSAIGYIDANDVDDSVRVILTF